MAGWTGKVLRVDLGNGTFQTEPMDPQSRSLYIGGRGAGVKLLYDEIDPRVDPLSPANKLILSAGPLTGTGAITGCLFSAVAKSPLTGCIASSPSQGFFGTELKHAGYDMLVLEGKAEAPVYLDISKGKVELVPAGHLWGLNTFQTEDLIKARMHDKWKALDTSIACIGPAGENLCRMASIVNDRHWAASHSGVGAVMGSKNLKAIVVNGVEDIYVASAKPFMDVVLAYIEQTRAAPLTSRVLPEQGTAFLVEKLSELGALPACNFQAILVDSSSVDGKALRRLSPRKMGCFSCPIGCEHLVSEGQDLEVMAPSLEVIGSLGPGCGVNNIEAVVRANRACLQMGLDPVSSGGTIACAMELSEAGAFPEEEVGFALRFGDAEAVLKLLELMARREGFGNVLAEGGRRLAGKYGRPDLFMGVRSQEMPGCDPRAIEGAGLHFATANSGPSFDSGDTLLTEILGINPSGVEGKAGLVKEAQDLSALMESVGLCRKMQMAGFSIPEVFAMMEMVTASGMNDADLMKAGERIFNLERMFNVRAGVEGGSDMLPRRMLDEPLKEGIAMGHVSRLPEMIAEYRGLRGWDERGTPSERKLDELGLTDAVAAGEAK